MRKTYFTHLMPASHDTHRLVQVGKDREGRVLVTVDDGRAVHEYRVKENPEHPEVVLEKKIDGVWREVR